MEYVHTIPNILLVHYKQLFWFEIQPNHLLALVLDTITVEIDIRRTT